MSAPRPYAFSRLDFVDSDFDPLASHLQDCTLERSFMSHAPTARTAALLVIGLLSLAALLALL